MQSGLVDGAHIKAQCLVAAAQELEQCLKQLRK